MTLYGLRLSTPKWDLAGTQITARQNAGGYNNYLAPIWRGKTS